MARRPFAAQASTANAPFTLLVAMQSCVADPDPHHFVRSGSALKLHGSEDSDPCW
jgi:hypothetical protein